MSFDRYNYKKVIKILLKVSMLYIRVYYYLFAFYALGLHAVCCVVQIIQKLYMMQFNPDKNNNKKYIFKLTAKAPFK